MSYEHISLFAIKWGKKCGLRGGCDGKELVIVRANEPVGGPCPRDRAIAEGQEKPWGAQEKTDM